MKYIYISSLLYIIPTGIKIEKINNLLQVDIDRREQGCAAHYEQYCQHVVTALFNCNNLVDNLFIVGCTTLVTPVNINLQQPVRF
jgi:hypothetical protein